MEKTSIIQCLNKNIKYTVNFFNNRKVGGLAMTWEAGMVVEMDEVQFFSI